MTASYAAGRIRIEIYGRRNENIETNSSEKKWRRICGASAFIIAMVIVFVVATRPRQSDQSQPFSKRFICKCMEYRKEKVTSKSFSFCHSLFFSAALMWALIFSCAREVLVGTDNLLVSTTGI